MDTLLTALYVIVDDLCHSHASEQRRPGLQASLCRSEVITLSTFARWSRLASERDFYRYAEAHLRGAFPTFPDRSQFNRLVRSHAAALEEIAVKLGRRRKVSPIPTQLLYLAQRPSRSASAEVRGSDGMVSSQFTPSV